MKKCAACQVAFEPRAAGQIACTFACARLMVAREHSRTRATRKAAEAQPRIAEALAETRANIWNLMRGRPS